MKNTEKDFSTEKERGSLNTPTQNNNKQPDIVMPDEEPTKILPITDKDSKTNEDGNNEEFNEDDINSAINEADEMDNSGADGNS